MSGRRFEGAQRGERWKIIAHDLAQLKHMSRKTRLPRPVYRNNISMKAILKEVREW
jgi:hypothetical protein